MDFGGKHLAKIDLGILTDSVKVIEKVVDEMLGGANFVDLFLIELIEDIRDVD